MIKILAIDDIPDNLISIKALINEAFPNAQVLTALNGEKGFELAVSSDPDVILLDIIMPGMDGFDVCQKIKSDAFLQDIPVVFITALKGDKELRIRALECGAEAFLSKPIDESELTAQIRAMIKIKTANIEKRNENERLAILVKSRTEELENELLERKKTEETIKISEEKYRVLFESSHDAIMTLDSSTSHFTTCNTATLEMFHISNVDAFKLLSPWDLSPEYQLDGQLSSVKVDKMIRIAMEKGVNFFEWTHKKYKGDSFPATVLLTRMEINNQYLIQATVRDITTEKKAEELLKNSEEKFSIAFKTSPYAIIITQPNDGQIIDFNNAFITLTGYSSEEIFKSTTILLGLWVNEEDRISVVKDLQEGEKIDSKEFKFKDKKENIITGLFSCHFITIKNEKYIISSINDITERKLIDEELQKAKEKAEESDRLKSAFLANMSHEIRTPMNGILGFANLLKEPNLSVEKQEEFFQIIESSGKRMLNILNDIINISKIESGEMKMYFSQTDVNEQINYIHSFFKPEADKKGLQFSYNKTLSNENSEIITDSEKVLAVLINLVKNAIKFTNKGGIEFGCDKKGNNLEFFVKDTGEGISIEKLNVIFERFRQGSESLSTRYEGAGLGLSISKAYVELLGGEIWVESELGIGSTFYFTIPYINN